MMKNALNNVTKILVFLTIAVHLMFFLIEAIFWMQPEVYNRLLYFIENPVALDYPLQALVLKKLFINQGFYNLFLAIAGLNGLQLLKKGKYETGSALILFLCFSATVAGIVLACSTKAYILAFFQTMPGATAFARLYPLYRNEMSKS
ncbi:putative membrane protein [Flavobacterium noncentrifugens]|uniref:Putative membrane protein n=2 Tax=Flavobacterium noncentrifugens TaxID=1128970 RepID=A0A1G8YDT7_9FLAO|nr:putative membrane protein [Flavobacterium noncentrifugens]